MRAEGLAELVRRSDDASALVRYLIERERSDPITRVRGRVEVVAFVLPARKRKPVEWAIRPHLAIRGGRCVANTPDDWWLDPIGRDGRARFEWWRESVKLGALTEVEDGLRKVRFVRWEVRS